MSASASARGAGEPCARVDSGRSAPASRAALNVSRTLACTNTMHRSLLARARGHEADVEAQARVDRRARGGRNATGRAGESVTRQPDSTAGVETDRGARSHSKQLRVQAGCVGCLEQKYPASAGARTRHSTADGWNTLFFLLESHRASVFNFPSPAGRGEGNNGGYFYLFLFLLPSRRRFYPSSSSCRPLHASSTTPRTHRTARARSYLYMIGGWHVPSGHTAGGSWASRGTFIREPRDWQYVVHATLPDVVGRWRSMEYCSSGDLSPSHGCAATFVLARIMYIYTLYSLGKKVGSDRKTNRTFGTSSSCCYLFPPRLRRHCYCAQRSSSGLGGCTGVVHCYCATAIIRTVTATLVVLYWGARGAEDRRGKC